MNFRASFQGFRTWFLHRKNAFLEGFRFDAPWLPCYSQALNVAGCLAS